MEESTEQSNASGKQNYLEEVIRESASRLGYKELKHEQMKAILSFVQGNDTFVALPTGYGKSLIYAALPYPAHMVFNDVISRCHQLNT